jgi:hypothetical protein
MESEYIAAAEVIKEAIWIRSFVEDTGLLKQACIPLFIDNNAALRLSRNPENHQRAKHIDIRYHFLRDRVVRHKDINTLRVDTKDNLADLLTKPLGSIIFHKLVGRMNLV